MDVVELLLAGACCCIATLWHVELSNNWEVCLMVMHASAISLCFNDFRKGVMVFFSASGKPFATYVYGLGTKS